MSWWLCHALKRLLHATAKGYSPMTNFTFSIEQVRSAPPEVRRWIEHEIMAALAALNRSEHDPSQVHTAALAACMPQEAAQLFEMIKGNFLLSQIFFELARDMPNSHGAAAASSLQRRRYPASHAAWRWRSARRLLHCDQSRVSDDPQRSGGDAIWLRSTGTCVHSPSDTRQHLSSLGAVVRYPCANG